MSFASRNTPVLAANNGLDTFTIAAGNKGLLGSFVSIPPGANAAWLQLIDGGVGNTPAGWWLDGNAAATGGLLLPVLGLIPLTNRAQLQSMVLAAGAANATFAVQFFEGAIGPMPPAPVFPDGGGSGPPPTPGITAIPAEHVVFVDSTFGNNATGQRERQDLPYETLAAAVAASQPGDTIWMWPAVHAIGLTLLNHDLSFAGPLGAVVDNSDALVLSAPNITFQSTVPILGDIAINNEDQTVVLQSCRDVTVSENGLTFTAEEIRHFDNAAGASNATINVALVNGNLHDNGNHQYGSTGSTTVGLVRGSATIDGSEMRVSIARASTLLLSATDTTVYMDRAATFVHTGAGSTLYINTYEASSQVNNATAVVWADRAQGDLILTNGRAYIGQCAGAVTVNGPGTVVAEGAPNTAVISGGGTLEVLCSRGRPDAPSTSQNYLIGGAGDTAGGTLVFAGRIDASSFVNGCIRTQGSGNSTIVLKAGAVLVSGANPSINHVSSGTCTVYSYNAYASTATSGTITLNGVLNIQPWVI